MTSSRLPGDRAEEAEQHERLVVHDVVRVDLLAPEPVGMAADHVLGGQQVVEARSFDGLGVLLQEAGVVAQIGVAEGDAESHGRWSLVLRQGPTPR